MMRRCGLLGEKLGHSYSPAIHAMLDDYAYPLYERSPEELDAFLRGGDWDGLNVTIPYKKTVLPYCDELSETARRIGSVNTLVRRPDGSLYGDNTDAYGFRLLIRRCGIDVGGKKAIVLGSGGASVTVCDVLREQGARSVTVISRGGKDNYENLDRHADAQIVVNTTPLGMYPNTGRAAVDLRRFPACEGVLDVVYNPARTALILQAEALGIPCASGLYMLVAQAKRSSELFTGRSIDDAVIDCIEHALAASMQNVVLIGMPGSGKSTIAAALGEKLGRPVCEADAEVERRAGRSIPEIFAESGEEVFRRLETEVLAELGKQSGTVIS
ncbi:MAG: shikimate kinase, partial [Oscillospiraceae bacterium]|nr:shikimate kinase [Oscillospiraceae bacterium]